MTDDVALDMATDVITSLATQTIQEKLRELPDSNLMEVRVVVDILLDLQQELIALTSSEPERVLSH